MIRRLLEPEIARDDALEVVLDLLGDIRGATEALETLLLDARTPGVTDQVTVARATTA